MFPANNYWNTPVAHLEVDPRSDAWMSHMSPGSELHPDFGKSYGEQPVPYGIPITIVDGDHAKVEVKFQYADESDAGPYPLGDDTKIEGGRGSDGDKHAIIVDSSTCELYETWNTRFKRARWLAGSGAIWDLTATSCVTTAGRRPTLPGWPILPGLLRYDEVKAGLVTHAIRFTTDETQTEHIWPARHDAGSTSSPNYPPMGARFRLDADFPTDGYRADTVVVLEAMKTYGHGAGRQRLAVVLPGHRRKALAERADRGAQDDPGQRVRGGRHRSHDGRPRQRRGGPTQVVEMPSSRPATDLELFDPASV